MKVQEMLRLAWARLTRRWVWHSPTGRTWLGGYGRVPSHLHCRAVETLWNEREECWEVWAWEAHGFYPDFGLAFPGYESGFDAIAAAELWMNGGDWYHLPANLICRKVYPGAGCINYKGKEIGR